MVRPVDSAPPPRAVFSNATDNLEASTQLTSTLIALSGALQNRYELSMLPGSGCNLGTLYSLLIYGTQSELRRQLGSWKTIENYEKTCSPDTVSRIRAYYGL